MNTSTFTLRVWALCGKLGPALSANLEAPVSEQSPHAPFQRGTRVAFEACVGHRWTRRLVATLLGCWLAIAGCPDALAQKMYDSSGRQIGRVDGERYYDASGRQIGRVDGQRIFDGSGRNLGRIDGERVYDSSGRQIGRIDGERLYSASGSQIGRLEGERLYDGSGRQIGRADGLRRMQAIVFFYFFM